jgi:hypothetical protein
VTNVLRSILAVGRMPLPARRAGTIQFWTLIFLSLLLHGVGVVKAQTSSAQLSGLVIDSSGARLAGVRVVIVNSNTRVTRESITNDSGGYNFSSLLPGGYDVSASKDGFTTAKEVGITLNVGDVRSVDLTLAVGQASQTVTITASAQLVNTDNSEVAQVIDEALVEFRLQEKITPADERVSEAIGNCLIAAGRFSESYGYLKPLASAAEAPESILINFATSSENSGHAVNEVGNGVISSARDSQIAIPKLRPKS